MSQAERMTADPRRLADLKVEDGYGYALAITAGEKTVVFPEQETVVSLLDDPLRLAREGIEGADLRAAVLHRGEKRGYNLVSARDGLALQFAIQRARTCFDSRNCGGYVVRRPKGNDFVPSYSIRDFWRAYGLLRPGGGKQIVDFSVAQCFLAVVNWGVAPNVDNRIFGPNGVRVVFQSGQADIERDTVGGLPDNGSSQVAHLAGAVLVEHQEDFERYVFCRQQRRGLYAGRWTIPEGIAKRLDEVTGLVEMEERMGSRVRKMVSCARPLCVADQRSLELSSGGNVVLGRDLCYVWRMPLRFIKQADNGSDVLRDNWPVDGDGGGDWSLLGEDDLYEVAKRGELTPIAQCALVAAGYLNPKECPSVSVRPSPLLR